MADTQDGATAAQPTNFDRAVFAALAGYEPSLDDLEECFRQERIGWSISTEISTIQSSHLGASHAVEIVTVHLTKKRSPRLGGDLLCVKVAGSNLRTVVNEALTRLDSIIHGENVCLDRARCPRCGAPLDVGSLRGGRPRCSACSWPHPDFQAPEHAEPGEA